MFLTNTIKKYEQDGMEKGLEQGKSNRTKEIIIASIFHGLDDTTIAGITGLSTDEVRVIRSQKQTL